MTKLFVYCENQEGGMETHYFSGPADAPHVYGWRSEYRKKSDDALLAWIDKAEIGDSYEHRLGLVVRLKDD